jgi:hypothetical protein
MMIVKDPAIAEALRESRHSVGRLRDVARRMDRLVPGIYGKRLKVDVYTDEGYVRSLLLVKEVKESSSKVWNRFTIPAMQSSTD